MNPFGVHALVFVPGWTEAEARHTIEAAGRCGFDTDISSKDAVVVRRGEDLLTRAVAVSAAVGASYLGGSPIAPREVPRATHGCSTGQRGSRAGVGCRLAAEAGVTVGMEPVNRYESHLANTAAQALALIEEVWCGQPGGPFRHIPHAHRGSTLEPSDRFSATEVMSAGRSSKRATCPPLTPMAVAMWVRRTDLTPCPVASLRAILVRDVTGRSSPITYLSM